ncbi:MAG: hypothetical protein MZV64_25755 [Ignavibacteriales bacterium]|nr:hypothetical protein [Ignavibacteriales bacterium]
MGTSTVSQLPAAMPVQQIRIFPIICTVLLYAGSDKAFEVILRTNPFPSITGMVCDHLCQNKCTRINYDEAVQIREVKRFISEQKEFRLKKAEKNGIKVAVIGAGPAGLSCAYYLSLRRILCQMFSKAEQRPVEWFSLQFPVSG